MSKGIVIIALGYPLYGNAAFNLALSLKHTSPEIPIALVYEPQSISKLSKKELTFFDEFIKLDEKFYTINGSKQYQRSKLCVNLIGNKLGWAETMYMDADNLWFDKPVSELFEKLKNKEFHIGYNGDYNVITKQQTGLRYTYWALRNEKDICKYHGIEKTLPQTVSGFVYFKNGPEADDIFKKARDVYDDPNAPTITWANGKPDEYCMNIALGLRDYKQEKSHIFYFDKINGYLEDKAMAQVYWGFATGGNSVSHKLQHLFNKRVNLLCEKHDVPTRHYHIDKKDIITERQKF